MTKPLNEHLLWKGKIQKSKYPLSTAKSPMIVPKICSLTGIPLKCPNIWNEITNSYKEYSSEYWNAVEERKHRYRSTS